MRERERESKTKELQTKIEKLESKANRTAEQEQKLKDLKQQMAGLKNSSKHWPWIIGGFVGGLALAAIIGGLVFYFWKKSKIKEE